MDLLEFICRLRDSGIGFRMAPVDMGIELRFFDRDDPSNGSLLFVSDDLIKQPVAFDTFLNISLGPVLAKIKRQRNETTPHTPHEN